MIGRDGSEAERKRSPPTGYLDDAVRESSGYRVMPGIERGRSERPEQACCSASSPATSSRPLTCVLGDLNRFFSFGGYGSDSRDRTELTRKALERGGVVAGSALDPAATIAVGDTPRDVVAGHGAGIRVVGVATGNYTVEQLREAGADWALAFSRNGFPV